METTAKFIQISSEALSIPDLSSTEVLEGSYKISITLRENSSGASTAYEITLNIKSALIFETEDIVAGNTTEDASIVVEESVIDEETT